MTQQTISKDLIAASATPLILSILSHGDSYGYAIIRQVREISAGELQWADGMLYPILHRLQKRKLIESYTGKAESGRTRKYYRLRPEGRAELDLLRNIWERLYKMLQQLEGEQQCLS